MFVSDLTIAELAARYGQPHAADFTIPVDREEFNRIKGSQKHGRKHDFTLYIFKGEDIVVIAKPFYPPGMYRAPSGGLHPGEDARTGIYREAMEETGCKIKLERFLLRTEVAFVCDNDTIEWNSYVFKASYLSGDFNFTDRREIKEVRLVRLSEFETFSRIMRESKIGGLHYRAALHDAVKELL